MQQHTAEIALQNKIASLSTAMLCNILETIIDTHTERELQLIIEAFIMKELEKRDPEAMIDWSNADSDQFWNKPSVFFVKQPLLN